MAHDRTGSDTFANGLTRWTEDEAFKIAAEELATPYENAFAQEESTGCSGAI